MTLTAFIPEPGMFPDDSATATEGRWIEGQWVRFVRKRPQVVGGWESFILSNLSGVCRGLHTWALVDGTSCVALGTNTHLYVIKAGALYDVTPVRATGTLTNPFKTTNASAIVTVADTAHGLSVADRVIYSGATAVGGLTIVGEYTVTSVVNSDSYTITAASAASSGATGGGTVTYTYLLPVGRVDGLGTQGWGTGAYGIGAYGTNIDAFNYRPRVWTFDNIGAKLIACPMDQTIYQWDGDTSVRATAVSDAPARVNTVFVDPKNASLHAAGATGSVTFEPMLERFSDSEIITDWTPSAADQAGDFPVYSGSRLVRGKASRGYNALWTDKELIISTYNGDPTLVYSYTNVGGGGLIGPNAATEHAGALFWMAPSGSFYTFTGGAPQQIPCPGRDLIFQNLSYVQADKIICFPVAAYNEIWWIYPDIRDGNECSRYAAVSLADGSWTFGAIARTAWIDAGTVAYPIATSPAGRVYLHEKGHSADGDTLQWSIIGAPFDIGDGQDVAEVQSIVPDIKEQLGIAEFRLYGRAYPQSVPVEYGPYLSDTNATRLWMLVRARQIAVQISGAGAPTYMRMGNPRLDVINTGDMF